MTTLPLLAEFGEEIGLVVVAIGGVVASAIGSVLHAVHCRRKARR